MSKEIIPSSSHNLKEVQQQFEQWRKTRKSRKPIPEHLWQAAVELAKQYSINHVARLLGLNHRALKEKVESSKQENPSFVEIPFPVELSPVHWTVEMNTPSGNKLRMSCQGEGTIQALVEIGKAFWGREQ